MFQSIHVLLYIYYHIVGEWGMNVAYRFILWVAVIFIERNDLLLKKKSATKPPDDHAFKLYLMNLVVFSN